MHTIPFVIDTTTGQEIDSDDFLSKLNTSSPEKKSDMRTNVLNNIKFGNPLYLCGFCHQPVYLCGGFHHNEKGKSFKDVYFKHRYSNPECKFYQKAKLSKEDILRIKFHGQKEGLKHINLKNIIAESLEKEGYKVSQEKVISIMELCKDGVDSDTFKRLWRKPDIQAEKGARKFVVEIQLATTFLSVILERMNFYKEDQRHIIWVLDSFNPFECQKSTTMDILSMTNRNILVLDDEMCKETRESGRLTFKCHYEIPSLLNDGNFSYQLEMKKVHIDELVFDNEKFITYLYDCWEEERKLLCSNELSNKNENLVVPVLPYINDNYFQVEDCPEDFYERELENNFKYIDSYSNEGIWEEIYHSLKRKEYSLLQYSFKKLSKSGCFMKEQPSYIFFRSLFLLAKRSKDYRDIASVVLCYEGFVYDIEAVFNDEVQNCYDSAWELSRDMKTLRMYSNLFLRNQIYIPDALYANNEKKLLRIMEETNDKSLSTEQREEIEKCLFIRMWKILESLNNIYYIEKINNDKILQFIIRLAGFSLPKPKPLACNHLNLAALAGTMKQFHSEYSHITVAILDLYNYKNNPNLRKNYKGIIEVMKKTTLDHSLDNFVCSLFKKLDSNFLKINTDMHLRQVL